MKIKILKLILFLSLTIFMLHPQASFAWEGHGYKHEHGHKHWHRDSHSFFSVDLSLWPDRHYYRDVVYTSPRYVYVSRPSFEPVLINGTTYYLNNGSYYVYTGYGYQLVTKPQVIETVIPHKQVLVSPSPANLEESMVVSILNDKGGYTSITLKRSGNGFIGPQGEFYSEFPKIAQLKTMYGK